MKSKLTFLGTGTSQGVPLIGCNCDVCRSQDPRDQRLRTSALIETENTRILIDAGPDLRQQLLHRPFRKIDAVLLTHIHYDHVAGLDDLRPYCKLGDIPVYANKNTLCGLQQTMPYCFTPELYPGVPKLELHEALLHKSIALGDLEVMPIQVMHGKLPILGYRIGSLAYITDMKSIHDGELSYLNGIETLVVNALRFDKEHHSHQLVEDAIDFSRKIGAKKTFFMHVTHEIGLHDVANSHLPKGFQFAYDGLELKF